MKSNIVKQFFRQISFLAVLTGKVRVIQNICDMACHENQKFWGIFFHTHMGTS